MGSRQGYEYQELVRVCGYEGNKGALGAVLWCCNGVETVNNKKIKCIRVTSHHLSQNHIEISILPNNIKGKNEFNILLTYCASHECIANFLPSHELLINIFFLCLYFWLLMYPTPSTHPLVCYLVIHFIFLFLFFVETTQRIWGSVV